MENLGEITGYSEIGLKPTKGNTIQIGSVIVHDFETGYFDTLKDGKLIFTHTE